MIILMGLAGSGKSTQGQLLAAATGKVWLSAGQVLRDTGDPEVKAIQESGKLVPNELVERLMIDGMLKAVREGKDVIIDGFPRDAEQAEWLAENLATVMKLVLIIEVPKSELIRRLELRGRSDDTREAIEERFRIVEQNICSICEILSAKGRGVNANSASSNRGRECIKNLYSAEQKWSYSKRLPPCVKAVGYWAIC